MTSSSITSLIKLGLTVFIAFSVSLSIGFSNTALAKDSLLKGKLSQPLPANLFVELSKLVNPSVVNIWTQKKRERGKDKGPQSRDPFFDLFEQYLGPDSRRNPHRNFGPGDEPPQEALGTGFVFRKDGLIITNAHVIEGADQIKVQFDKKGGKSFDAKLIGKDKRTDIALIKIQGGGTFPTVKLGSSKDLRVGEWVAAFGNPLGLGHTMTKGIISAIGREIGELNRFPFLQTDASINPGNSGGPLVSTDGYVIGVNSAIARGNGIGFAIPIDDVKFIVRKLEKDGRVTRGFIGVSFKELSDSAVTYFKLKSKQGLLVQSIFPDGPAAAAGIEPGDIIIDFDGRKIYSSSDLVNAVGNTDIGLKKKIKVLRDGKEMVKRIKIGVHPDDREKSTKKTVSKKSKSYRGQKAPFEFGFFIDDFSEALGHEFELPQNTPKNPVIIEVAQGSPAAKANLVPGDVILAINRKKVRSAKDVLKRLKNGPNALTIWRRGSQLFVFMEP